MIKVLIEATGVVTHVSDDYYEKYKDQGLTKVVEKPKRATRKPKVKPLEKEV